MLILRTIGIALLALAAVLPARAQNVAHGSTLYHQTCITCHGFPPSGGPELAPNNPSLISQAINSLVPAMSFLRGVYTTSDLTDIAAYIASLSAPPPPPGPPVPAFNYSDLWWNSAESGWGFNLIQHPSNAVFCVMFTYNTPNVPMWYVVTGITWNTSTSFTGDIYRVTGSPPNLAFKGGDVVKVGSASMIFTDQSNGTLALTIDGVTVTKSVQRQPF